MPASDGWKHEVERVGRSVDHYFDSVGAVFGQWADLPPVLGFHRTLRDYWNAFTKVGFAVHGFEEPSVTERGMHSNSHMMRYDDI
jgi:hypothetical protein